MFETTNQISTHWQIDLQLDLQLGAAGFFQLMALNKAEMVARSSHRPSAPAVQQWWG